MVPSESFHARVLHCLVEGGARFVVVGGVAVNLQGVPRFTADIDVAIAVEASSLRTAARGLAGLGLTPRLPVPASQLEDPDTVRDWIENRNLRAFTFQDPRDPLHQVDLLLACDVPFEEIASSAEEFHAFGIHIPVASIETLIRMKQDTGREQDASDVAALRRIQSMRHEDE